METVLTLVVILLGYAIHLLVPLSALAFGVWWFRQLPRWLAPAERAAPLAPDQVIAWCCPWCGIRNQSKTLLCARCGAPPAADTPYMKFTPTSTGSDRA